MSAIIRYAGCLCLMLASSPLFAAYQLDMSPGVTSFSQGAYEIHQYVMWICVAIGVVVFGAMAYSIIFHRKSKGAVAAKFDDNVTVEILWTIIPIFILVSMAIPATNVLLEMEDTSKSDMSIKVTGYQWKWHYEYLDEDISFFSNISTPEAASLATNASVPKDENYLMEVDNRVVIPANKKVRFLFTSNDVIHAWWIPAFGVKKDALPGFINEAWARVAEPGVYRGKCAELCGMNHGFMPIVVEVKSEADYAAWVGEQKAAKSALAASATKTWTMAELMKHGEKVYTTNCVACHQVSGEGIPAAGFPALKGGAIATGDAAKHIDIVLKGSPGTAMQAFGAQLNDADLAALITYERNAWGNNTGDTVQPSDIKSAR
ncbi:MAG: cytochrome c oxidase subunit II [Gammaproteobacteria bacterium]|nr:cytochrome c oxidase subunit II [Gammaproteobacteria bacterium]